MGLGVGTLAAYGEPGQRWTFYEIDPSVVRTAREYFFYLADCKATVDVVVGDGRLSLAREPDDSFDIIVLDAFSSDALPLHLLTREAMEMYLRKLRAGGVLAFHLSQTAADLTLVLANLSRDLGLVFRTKGTGAEEQPDRVMRAGTFWGMVARQPQDIAALSEEAGWSPQTGRADLAAWSDDFTNLWSVLQLR
jgi:SAM-dependent methyltransferase